MRAGCAERFRYASSMLRIVRSLPRTASLSAQPARMTKRPKHQKTGGAETPPENQISENCRMRHCRQFQSSFPKPKYPGRPVDVTPSMKIERLLFLAISITSSGLLTFWSLT